MPKGVRGSSPACSIKGCERRHEARGWCATHYEHWRRFGSPITLSIEERFLSYVDLDGPVPSFAPDLGPCSLWELKPNRGGYGVFGVGTSPEGKQINRLAYDWAWEQEHGPVPDGCQLDHLCRVRLCVRTSHLEVVTQTENQRRGLNGVLKTECPQGHPYDEANTLYRANGNRRCRRCHADQERNRKAASR